MRNFIVIVLILGGVMNGFSQKLTIDIEGFPTFTQDYGRVFIVPYAGFGMTYNYNKLGTGFSYRSVPWGSEVSVNQAYNLALWESDKVSLGNTSMLHVGIPLYYNKFSTSFGVSSRINLKFNNFKRVFFSGGLGYHINPTYQNISSKYQYWEGVLALHITLIK